MKPLTVYNILIENKCRTTARQRVHIGRYISQHFEEQMKIKQNENGDLYKVNSYDEKDREMITSLVLSLYRKFTKKRPRTSNDNHFQKFHRDKNTTLYNGHGGC